jgi:hypothetical protein
VTVSVTGALNDALRLGAWIIAVAVLFDIVAYLVGGDGYLGTLRRSLGRPAARFVFVAIALLVTIVVCGGLLHPFEGNPTPLDRLAWSAAELFRPTDGLNGLVVPLIHPATTPKDLLWIGVARLAYGAAIARTVLRLSAFARRDEDYLSVAGDLSLIGQFRKADEWLARVDVARRAREWHSAAASARLGMGDVDGAIEAATTAFAGDPRSPIMLIVACAMLMPVGKGHVLKLIETLLDGDWPTLAITPLMQGLFKARPDLEPEASALLYRSVTNPVAAAMKMFWAEQFAALASIPDEAFLTLNQTEQGALRILRVIGTVITETRTKGVAGSDDGRTLALAIMHRWMRDEYPRVRAAFDTAADSREAMGLFAVTSLLRVAIKDIGPEYLATCDQLVSILDRRVGPAPVDLLDGT